MNVAIIYTCPDCGFGNVTPLLGIGIKGSCDHPECQVPPYLDGYVVGIRCGACGSVLLQTAELQAMYGIPTCAN